jgi:hypothetical protein
MGSDGTEYVDILRFTMKFYYDFILKITLIIVPDNWNSMLSINITLR